jgi:FlgD Ig-like domain
MPHSRHASSHSHSDRANMTPRKRSGTRRFGWFAVLAAASVVLYTAVTLAAGGHQASLTSDSTNTVLLGSSASNPGYLAQSTSEFGHLPIIRTYYPHMPDPNAWTTGAPGINKSAVVLSFNEPPATILSGAENAALSHFFDTAPTGHPIYYSYYDEPEPYITNGTFTLAQYKAAWAHIVAIANAAHNPDLKSTLILMSWDLDPRSGINWKDFLPSGGVISTLGWDAYPAGTVHDQNPQPTAPAAFMGPEAAASKSVGLPFGFAEFALGTPAGRPAWLAAVASYLQSSGALFGTLFNSPGFPWMQLNDAASIQAWRSAVHQSASNVPVAGPIARPAPKPSPSASATPAPPPNSPGISGLAVSPATFAPTGANHARITFALSQSADVTVCVLDSQGTVVRTLPKPGEPAGAGTIWWWGYNNAGHRVPAGRYTILAVASNANGSTTTETVATITAP